MPTSSFLASLLPLVRTRNLQPSASLGTRCIQGIALGALLVVALPAQTNWAQRAPATSPSARFDHSMVYDATRRRVVLFGGGDAQTWEWDGTNWSQRTPVTNPSAGLGSIGGSSAMAYDSVRQRVVLFGDSGTASETWEWDGTNWTRRTPTTSPSRRTQHELVYDATRQRVVLFGGYISSTATVLGDTWEWDGTNWTQRAPAASPSVRIEHAMAYDSVRQRVVLFGGANNYPNALAGTWEWDGTNWTQRSPATSPSARWGHTLVYDSARQRIVLFAGDNGGVSPFADTWEFDGTNWTQRTTAASPSARSNQAAAYDSARQRVVLFGGLTPGPIVSDTWEYSPNNPAAYTPYGAGCPTTSGTPSLGSNQGSLPWIGETFSARLTNLGASPTLNLPFLLLGDSNTMYGALPLPYDLSIIGMTGCSLYTSKILSFNLTNTGGAATWTINIPNVARYAGRSLYTQCGVTDASANRLGIAMSNACELKMGSK